MHSIDIPVCFINANRLDLDEQRYFINVLLEHF